jgi:hypothetical protein
LKSLRTKIQNIEDIQMPNINTKANVLVRDGFKCRYCGAQLFLAQAIKVLDMLKPGRIYWDAHWKKEPLKSSGATVDHIKSEDKGGFDTPENLVACCVVCNSSKGKGQRTLLSQSLDRSWDGLSGKFLAIGPRFEELLSKEDKKWLKALEREGIMPDDADLSTAKNERKTGN